MKKAKIIKYPNPILKKRSQEVSEITPSVDNIIEQMIYTLRAEDIGVGLSAPQIGHSKQIVVIESSEIKDKDGNILSKAIPLTILINPKVTKTSQAKSITEEGCLSYPNYYGPVERPEKIRFRALDRKKNNINGNASGLLARIIQHEIDHLEGILFFEKVPKGKLKKGSPSKEINEEM